MVHFLFATKLYNAELMLADIAIRMQTYKADEQWDAVAALASLAQSRYEAPQGDDDFLHSPPRRHSLLAPWKKTMTIFKNTQDRNLRKKRKQAIKQRRMTVRRLDLSVEVPRTIAAPVG